VKYDERDVEPDSSEEYDEFDKTEKETVEINLPAEAYIVQYKDVEEIIMPVLLGDDQKDDESEDDIMKTIDAETEEIAKKEEEEEGEARIREISMELEEPSRKAGLLTLPPLESILPMKGKGKLIRTEITTPGIAMPCFCAGERKENKERL